MRTLMIPCAGPEAWLAGVRGLPSSNLSTSSRYFRPTLREGLKEGTHGVLLSGAAPCWIGAPTEDDDMPFESRMRQLLAALREQRTEGARLDRAIAAYLKELGYGD